MCMSNIRCPDGGRLTKQDKWKSSRNHAIGILKKHLTSSETANNEIYIITVFVFFLEINGLSICISYLFTCCCCCNPMRHYYSHGRKTARIQDSSILLDHNIPDWETFLIKLYAQFLIIKSPYLSVLKMSSTCPDYTMLTHFLITESQ